MKILIYSLLLLGLVRCKSLKLPASYASEVFPIRTLNLNKDSTFEFHSYNTNPYHFNGYSFMTKGTWAILNGKLLLSSYTDTFDNIEPIINSTPAKNPDFSTFVFINIYDDTIMINQVYRSTSTSRQGNTGPTKFYSTNIKDVKSIEFSIPGNKQSWIFEPKNYINHDHSIIIYPAYQAAVFKKYSFKIKGKTLISEKENVRFLAK